MFEGHSLLLEKVYALLLPRYTRQETGVPMDAKQARHTAFVLTKRKLLSTHPDSKKKASDMYIIYIY